MTLYLQRPPKQMFKGDTGTIIGIGPGLDAWAESPTWFQSATNTIKINEAAAIHPHIGYGLAMDTAPVKRLGEWFAAANPEDGPHMIVSGMVWGNDQVFEKSGAWFKDNGCWLGSTSAKEWSRRGTATVAMGLLYESGIRRIRLVGFDAYWAWLDKKKDPSAYETAECVREILDATDGSKRGGENSAYDKISIHLHSTAKSRGIELVRA